MKKVAIFFIILFSFFKISFSEVSVTNYNNWTVKTIYYEHNDNRSVAIYTTIDDALEVYIASRKNQINITLSWFDHKVDESIPFLEYTFDNKKANVVEPAVRSSKQNFDILYTISPSFGITQEDEIVLFFKELINSKTLTIKPNLDDKTYNVNLKGLKEAISKTDFSKTLFDDYKNKVL